MSSSLTYTLTNLWSAPDSSTSWPARAGYVAVSALNTSPTVAPSADTDAAPSAWGRSKVGSRTSTAITALYNSTRSVKIPAFPASRRPRPRPARGGLQRSGPHRDDPPMLDRLPDRLLEPRWSGPVAALLLLPLRLVTGVFLVGVGIGKFTDHASEVADFRHY